MKDAIYFLKFFLVSIFGWTGWQRFVQKKYLSGFAFLFTLGLFFVGWIFDICRIAYFKEK